MDNAIEEMLAVIVVAICAAFLVVALKAIISSGGSLSNMISALTEAIVH